MSDDQKDALLGKLVRESKEIADIIALRRSEARRLGEMYAELSLALIDCPETIQIEGMPSELAYQGTAAFQSKYIDIQKLKEVVLGLRAALERQKIILRDIV